MKKLLLFLTSFLFSTFLFAQIYEPEGLNIPGGWNGWANPPVANSVFGSSTQVSGGKVTKITSGTTRWQTTIKVADTLGNISEGTYEFLFTSGPAASAFNNKWAGVNVEFNLLQTYTYNTGNNNSIFVENGNWYVINWKDSGYTNTQAIFMKLSNKPITITNVTDDYSGPGNDVTVSITTSDIPAVEQKIFVRYTKDGWATSNFVQAGGPLTTYFAVIPGADVSGTIQNNYYVFTTTVSNPTHEDADMETINFANNSGDNYALPVELTSFFATVNGNKVILSWNTATETQNSGFEIERYSRPNAISKMDALWTKIGFVEGQGNSTTPKSYSFEDSPTAGNILYRLKQINRDGTFSFSHFVEVNVSDIPTQLALLQNYPNPFNPSTTLRFTLPQTGKVRVVVSNVLGQQVAVVADREFNAGTIDLPFNAANLSSGMYYYTITANGKSVTKTMMLMK